MLFDRQQIALLQRAFEPPGGETPRSSDWNQSTTLGKLVQDGPILAPPGMRGGDIPACPPPPPVPPAKHCPTGPSKTRSADWNQSAAGANKPTSVYLVIPPHHLAAAYILSGALLCAASVTRSPAAYTFIFPCLALTTSLHVFLSWGAGMPLTTLLVSGLWVGWAASFLHAILTRTPAPGLVACVLLSLVQVTLSQRSPVHRTRVYLTIWTILCTTAVSIVALVHFMSPAAARCLYIAVPIVTLQCVSAAALGGETRIAWIYD